MKKKMIIGSILAFLIIATSFSVNSESISSNSETTEDLLETAGGPYSITVSGLLRVKVTISSAQDTDHIFGVWLKFGSGYKFKELPRGEGTIKGESTTYRSMPLFLRRLPWNNEDKELINSHSGTIRVFVEIRDPIPGRPGWYTIVQDEEITGTFSGPLFNW
jgi:hypothetical protein